MYACFREPGYSDNAKNFLYQLNLADATALDKLLEGLAAAKIEFSPYRKEGQDAALGSILSSLAQHGFLQFHSASKDAALTLSPVSQDFDMRQEQSLEAANWKISRFSYLQHYGGTMQIRNPQATCYLIVRHADILSILFQLNQPCAREALVFSTDLTAQQNKIFEMMVCARVILPCDEQQRSSEETDPMQMQWDFHDMLFHSSSRFGRSDRPIGGTFRFKGILEPQPVVKSNPWAEQAIALAVPDLQELYFRDIPLTAAIESRRSNRSHSPIALDVEQLGHFLYRTVRNRYSYDSPYGEFTSRPYPCGGANYEQEFYLTINACAGLKRGLYYYAPQHHTLCLVSAPCLDMEALLDDAYLASAQQCRPQILITIASRFNRFNWKYTGMSYAAQLKNIGAIYQTMYLVATSMHIAACALGTGNTDRLCRLTGLDYLQEGSLGEFMLGRSLY